MYPRIQIHQLLEVRSHHNLLQNNEYKQETDTMDSLGGREKALAAKATDAATHAKHEVKEGVTAAVEKVREATK
jgi:hypothetical protein